MIIKLERTGGFTAIPLQIIVDTNKLPTSEAEALLDLAASADFFNLPEIISVSGPGADRFLYRITLGAGPLSHTVEAVEKNMPPELNALVDELVRRARHARAQNEED